MKVFIAIAVFCYALNGIEAAPKVSAAADEDTLELTILHNNDMHARFEQVNQRSGICSDEDATANKCYGGFSRVATLVREYRSKAAEVNGKPVLYLNAGDTYTGTTWFYVFKWNITAAFLNILMPDAASLGNHEFDNGVAGLVPLLNELDFPIVAANLDLSKTPEMQNTKSLQTSIVVEKNGFKIGIIGYITPETKVLATTNTVEFYDEIESINTEAEKLKQAGVTIIIALGHSGFDMDKKIAGECPEVDLVIGGHTNTFLYNGDAPDLEVPVDAYPVVIQNNGKKVPVIQAYAYTKYLGKLDVTFDKNGDLITFEGQPILLDSKIAQAADVEELLETFRPAIDELENDIIGKTRVLLDGSETSCRMQECNMGNLIADAMVWSYAKYLMREEAYVPLAFMQGGGIRGSIDPTTTNGQISMADLINVLPFGSTLAVMRLTGAEVKLALEHSVARYSETQGYGEFLQVSGMRIIYDLEKEPQDRVQHVEVLCGECETPVYEALKSETVYRIVTTSYLLEGQDGFEVFKGKGITIAIDDVDSLRDYIRAMDTVYPGIESRIVYAAGDDGGATSIVLSTSLLFLTVSSLISRMF